MTMPPDRDANDSRDPVRDQIHDLLDHRMSDADAERLRARIEADPELRREYTELSRLIGDLAILRDERAPRAMKSAVLAAARPAPSSGGGSRLLALVAPLAAAIVLSALVFAFNRGWRTGAGETERASGGSKVAMEKERALEDSSEPADERLAAAPPAERLDDAKGEAASRRDSGGLAAKAPEKPALGKPPAAADKDSKPVSRSGAKPAGEPKYKAPVKATDLEEAKNVGAVTESEKRKANAGAPGTVPPPEPPRLWRIHKSAPASSLDAQTKSSGAGLTATLGRPITSEKEVANAIAALPAPARAAVEAARKRSPSSVRVVELSASESAEFVERAAKAQVDVEEFATSVASREDTNGAAENARRSEESDRSDSDAAKASWRSLSSAKDPKDQIRGPAASGPQRGASPGPQAQGAGKKQPAGDDAGRASSKVKSVAKGAEKPAAPAEGKAPKDAPAAGTAWKSEPGSRRIVIVIDEP